MVSELRSTADGFVNTVSEMRCCFQGLERIDIIYITHVFEEKLNAKRSTLGTDVP
jgi:hypothetical protein